MEKVDTTMTFKLLIEDDEFKQITDSTVLSEVFFTLLQKYVPKFTKDYNLQKDLACKLYLYYLKQKEGKIKNLYEKVLLKFCGFFSLPEDMMNFFLSRDLDLNYEGIDMYGTPALLKDTLALTLKSPKLMGDFLDRIKGNTLQYFGNEHYEFYTDTVQMNLVAGRIAEAIRLFESEEYMVFPQDEKTVIRELPQSHGLYVGDFFDGKADSLTAAIGATHDSSVPLELKRAFLNTILYSHKIKLFNVSNLSRIKAILTEDEYQRFIHYLTVKVESREITCYSYERCTDLIQYENLNAFLESDKAKSLSYSLPNKH